MQMVNTFPQHSELAFIKAQQEKHQLIKDEVESIQSQIKTMVEGLKKKVPDYEKAKLQQDSDIIEISRKKTSPVMVEEPAI